MGGDIKTMIGMKYWRHPVSVSVGTNWAPLRVVGYVVFALVFVLLPIPFGGFAPYGSWLFWLSLAFWGGLCALCVILVIAKLRAKKAASEKSSELLDK